VKLRPFRIDKAAVTNARFKAIVEDAGYVTKAEALGWSFVFCKHLPQNAGATRAVSNAEWWRRVEGASWKLINGLGSEADWREDHLVVHVSWNDAKAFAQWPSGRLPA
jgi:formylglycine-generating enzyme required for sulfatase activity